MAVCRDFQERNLQGIHKLLPKVKNFCLSLQLQQPTIRALGLSYHIVEHAFEELRKDTIIYSASLLSHAMHKIDFFLSRSTSVFCMHAKVVLNIWDYQFVPWHGPNFSLIIPCWIKVCQIREQGFKILCKYVDISNSKGNRNIL